MIPVTAALAAVMIVFAFGAAGYWMPDAITAAGGALSALARLDVALTR